METGNYLLVHCVSQRHDRLTDRTPREAKSDHRLSPEKLLRAVKDHPVIWKKSPQAAPQQLNGRDYSYPTLIRQALTLLPTKELVIRLGIGIA